MPTNKKKKGGKGKGATARSNAANKDDLAGLDDILGNTEEMAAAERAAWHNGTGYKPKSGRENAQIGLRGFAQAQQNPAMFTDAMSMLGDAAAVKEAESMMADPEFKNEIAAYMQTLKNNDAFRQAMAEAQRKYQALLADPDKMKAATEKYNAIMKAQQEAIAAGETPAPFSAVEVAKAAETAGGGKSDAAEKQPAAVKEIGGEPEAAGAEAVAGKGLGGVRDEEAGKAIESSEAAGDPEVEADAGAGGETAST